jgi:membrane protease YdiL (CAAX protease family)
MRPLRTIPSQQHTPARLPLLFWSGVVLFLVNDFWLLAITSTVGFYIADYVFRLGLLALAGLWMASERFTLREAASVLFVRRSVSRDSDTGSISTGHRLAGWIVLTSAVCVLVNQTLYPFLLYRVPSLPLIRRAYPMLSGPAKLVDLTIGIALVAVTEEVWFRSMALRVFRALKWPTWLIVIASALLFGLAHWSHGTGPVIANTVWGALLMLTLLRTGSLWPAMIAHFATDVVAFSGLIPEAYYNWIM